VSTPAAPAESLCLLSGRVVPLAQAAIHPLDRGFLFGDGIYEVVKVLAGTPILLGEHLERLANGLAALQIPPPAGLEADCRRLLETTAVTDGSLYLQVTRGAGPRAHLPPRDLVPTVFAIASGHRHPGEERLAGARVVTCPDPRWGRCDLKTVSLAGTVLGKLRAREAAAREVLFVGPGGEIREGGSSSFLTIRGGTLETHPLDHHILPGISRRQVIGLARELGLAVVERAPLLAERITWEEAFLCGTLTTVEGVVTVDGEPVGDGRVGPWTRRLMAAYDRAERRFAAAPG
jgi:D-alanine transaminase